MNVLRNVVIVFLLLVVMVLAMILTYEMCHEHMDAAILVFPIFMALAGCAALESGKEKSNG